MKKTLILFLLLFASPSIAAVVFVKDTGSGVYYESGASSCSDVTTDDTAGDLEAALNAAGSGGTLYVCAGTFSGAEIDASDSLDTTHDNQRIEGIGTAIIDGTGCADHVLTQRHAGMYLKNVTLQNPDSGKRVFHTDYSGTIDGCVVQGSPDQNGIYIVTGAGEVFTIKNTKARSNGDENIGVFGTGGDVYVNNCEITDGIQSGIYNAGAANLYVNHCIIARNTRAGYQSNSTITGIAELNNSAIFANDTANAGFESIIGPTTGTLTINNSFVLSSPIYSSSYISNATENNLQEYKIPKFTANSKKGILIIGVDDYSSLSYLQSLVAADPYGYTWTYAIDNTYLVTQADWTTIAALYNAGSILPVSHTRHAAQLGTREAFTIQYTGAGSAVLTIANDTLSIEVTGGGDEDVGPLDLANTSYNIVQEVVDALNALPTYTCAGYGSPANTGSSSIRLADVSVNIDSAQDISYDQTEWYDDEISGSVADIEAGIPGYLCKVIVPPNNSTDETARDAMKTRGLIGARGESAATYNASNHLLSSLDIYNIHTVNISSLVDKANISRDAPPLLEWMAEMGVITFLYAHSAAEYTAEQWMEFLGYVNQSNVVVMSLQDAVEHITNAQNGVLPAGTDSGDGETWTRTFTDASNYRLQSDSPLIGVGTYTISHDLSGEFIAPYDPINISPYHGIDRPNGIGLLLSGAWGN